MSWPAGERSIDPRGSRRLPLILTVVCLAASAWLYVSAVRPALVERDMLRQVDSRQVQLLEALRAGNDELGARLETLGHSADGENGVIDPQTVLVEIDRLNMTPAELLRRYGHPVDPADPSHATLLPNRNREVSRR